MRSVPFGLALALTFACSLHVRNASADDAREQSRAAFRRGVTLAKENDYAGARDAFAEAYRLFPHPSILLNLGMARGRSGQLVDAEQDLAKFLADDGGASAEEIKSARQMLADVRDKLGTLLLEVKTAGSKATLDGKPIALVPGQAVSVRAVAGQHAIHVEAEGFLPAEQMVDLVSKIETPLAITLQPRAVAEIPEAGGSKGGGSRATIGWVLVGGAVAVGGTGGYFGLRALGMRRDWNALSAQEQQEQVALKDRGKLNALVADVLYASAIVVGGVGVYFLLTPSKGREAPKHQANFVVGPAFTGVRGSF